MNRNMIENESKPSSRSSVSRSLKTEILQNTKKSDTNDTWNT